MICGKCEGDIKHCATKGCQENTIVVGLTGVKTSGKSTSFEFIKQICGDVQEVMIAKKLKQVCSKVFNLSSEHFESQNLKEKVLQNPAILTQEKIKECFNEFFPNEIILSS